MTRLACLTLVLLACGEYDDPSLVDQDDGNETGGAEASGGFAGGGAPATGGAEPTGGVETGGFAGAVVTGGVSSGGAVLTGGAFPTGGSAAGGAPNACPQIRACEGRATCSASLGSTCGACQLGTFQCEDRQGYYASSGSEWPCNGSDCSAAIQAQVSFCASPTCSTGTGGSSSGGSGGSGQAGGPGTRMLWSREFTYTGTIVAGTSSRQDLNIYSAYPADSCLIVSPGNVPHGATPTTTAGLGNRLSVCLNSVPSTSVSRHEYEFEARDSDTTLTGGGNFDLPVESRNWRPTTVVRRVLQNDWNPGAVTVRTVWEFWE